MNSLELSLDVAHGGKLTASESGWSLTYYFPGPDRRWNGTILKIDSTMVQQYIEGWTSNWQQYLALRNSTPGVAFSSEGAMGMKVGESGVRFYGLTVTSETELAAMRASLIFAASKGAELRQEILRRAGRTELAPDIRRERFERFKAGESFGTSTNPDVVRELSQALSLVRSKFKIEITSCRHRVRNWFGTQAAEEFMDDIRSHGLDVFCEQADFVITWNGWR